MPLGSIPSTTHTKKRIKTGLQRPNERVVCTMVISDLDHGNDISHFNSSFPRHYITYGRVN